MESNGGEGFVWGRMEGIGGYLNNQETDLKSVFF